MQFFSSLVLNRARIVLQTIRMTAQMIVFLLQLLHLGLQAASFLALMRKRGQSVVPEDHAISHHQSQHRKRNRRRTPSPRKNPLARRFDQRRQPADPLRTVIHERQLQGPLQRLLSVSNISGRIPTALSKGNQTRRHSRTDSARLYTVNLSANRSPLSCTKAVFAKSPLLSLARLMRILFAISILAFLALLWATIAIVQHVRRARRRKRRFLESAPTPLRSASSGLGLASLPPTRAVPELSFTDLAAPPPPRPEPVSVADELPVETEAATSEPELTLQTEEHLESKAQPETSPEPEPLQIDPEPEPEITAKAEEQLEAEAEPTSEPEASPESETSPETTTEATTEPQSTAQPEPIPETTPEPFQAAIPEPPPLKRPIRIGPPKHLLAQLVQPIHRPDWAYFNKDMGDLSDPEPRADTRPKIRIAKSASRP